jgi:hypothetical protein
MKIKFINLYESYHPNFIENLYKITMEEIHGKSPFEFSDEIYELLTKDHDWEQQKTSLSKDDWKIYHQMTALYTENNKKLIDFAKSKGWMTKQSSWLYFIKDQEKPPPKFQRKIYLTLSKKRSDFQSILDSLFNFINLLDQSQLIGRKHFKIGITYLLFMNHLDNMVIYGDNEEDIKTLDDIVKKSGFILRDRDSIGRTSKGIDIGRKSDTQLVADNFAQYIQFNKEKIKNTLKSVDKVKQGLVNVLKNIMMNSQHRSIGNNI